MDDATKPAPESDRPNASVLHQREGDARRPAEHLDKEQEPAPGEGETIPRKSSLIE